MFGSRCSTHYAVGDMQLHVAVLVCVGVLCATAAASTCDGESILKLMRDACVVRRRRDASPGERAAGEEQLVLPRAGRLPHGLHDQFWESLLELADSEEKTVLSRALRKSSKFHQLISVCCRRTCTAKDFRVLCGPPRKT
ncbi:uncharacterized protein LOC126282128 [Schistocerca gregaria]|uniref:uncharacterized protein LOC126282128 n=1 Tax=Schistocerca gregaria TaxID=7010 RepID=UPI00211ED85E|nr:uncharacterized protein LOC126282128 [Schistocerca gregaria]UGX04200.1 gonadulin [Schistocerca gregaria]